MTDFITLDEQQERDAQGIAVEPTLAALDASTPGAGKTVVAIRVAQLRGAQQVLVIAPLGTRADWKIAAQQMGWDVPFYWVSNKKGGAEALIHLQFGEPGLFFIGPEYATSLAWDDTGHTTDTGKKIKKRNKFWDSVHPDMLIVDEVHKGTVNARSLRHKFYASLHYGFVLALSGTPAGQNWDGIYPVTKFLWPDAVPKNTTEFKRKYCKTEFDPFAWDKMKVVAERVPGEYFADLPCVVRRMWEYEGVIDESTVWVELGAAQRKAYNELEKRMVTEIEGDPFVIEFPASKRIRLRQATLGMFSVDENDSVYFADDSKSTKLDALKKVLADDFHGEPTLILTDSKRFAKVTVNRIQSWGFTAEEFSGDVSQGERDAVRARFRGGMTAYVVMVIKAGGTGLNGLQESTRNLVILSQDDARIENEQAMARVVRRGQGDLVRIRYILAEDTYDAGVMSKHLEDAIAMNRSYRVDNVSVSR